MGTKLGQAARVSAVVSAVALVGLAGVGCSHDGQTQLESPVMVTLDNLDGESIEISRNRPLVIPVGENHDAAQWTQGQADDPTIAEFTPGKGHGVEHTAPGFRAVGTGSTNAHLTNPETNETYTFTLVVK